MTFGFPAEFDRPQDFKRVEKGGYCCGACRNTWRLGLLFPNHESVGTKKWTRKS
jgi:hypothetical protein